MTRFSVLIMIVLGFVALGLEYTFLGAFLLTMGVSLYVAAVEKEFQKLHGLVVLAISAIDKRQDAAQEALQATGNIAVEALKNGGLAREMLEYDVAELRPELKSFYEERRSLYDAAEKKARDEAAAFRAELEKAAAAEPMFRA